MSELRKSLGLGGIALASIACCIGLPLIAAAGFSIAAFAWVGGIAVGAIASVAVLALLVVQIRTRRSCQVPASPTRRSPL